VQHDRARGVGKIAKPRVMPRIQHHVLVELADAIIDSVLLNLLHQYCIACHDSEQMTSVTAMYLRVCNNTENSY
jgi:hypothetical protein